MLCDGWCVGDGCYGDGECSVMVSVLVMVMCDGDGGYGDGDTNPSLSVVSGSCLPGA